MVLTRACFDDRGEVDLGDVGRPVDRPRVEVERRSVGVVEFAPREHQVVDLVDRLALGVEAVQLDVGERPLDLGALRLDLRRPVGLASAQRQVLQHLLAGGQDRLGPVQLALDATAPRESELGDDDRLALGVVDRMLEEPAADVVDEHPVLQRVDAARGHLRDLGSSLGAQRGHRDDRSDHDVDRDHVDGPFGNAGELVEQAAGVGDQHRLGHAEATDPARLRFGECRLDDRGADDRHRHGALDVGERLLAERLGERVRVGPADAGRTCPPGFDELVLHPLLAQLLGLRCERRSAGGAELGAGLLAERLELLAAAAGGVGVGPQASARGDLVAPVDADVERAVADELLGCVAAPVAGDVTGRHGDEVWGDADVIAQVGDARRAEEVDLHGGVERRVERHGRSGVDHGVAAGEDRAVGVVQSQPVTGDVAGDRGDPGGHGGEVDALLAALGAESVERVVLEDLALGSPCRTGSLAVSHEQHQLAVGDRAQQALDERGADESGRAGDGDPFPRERFGDHG